MATHHLAFFRCDVTPSLGHPLCGGWIEPVRGVDDPLFALGVILLGEGKPVVLTAVDWCGLRNHAHLEFRNALAEATHTTPECVAVQCVHQHNAPFADVRAEKLIEKTKSPTRSLDLKWFQEAVKNVAANARQALASTQAITHIGMGQAKVKEVASNRRIVNEKGRVEFTRFSATRDPKIRAFPEGLIDPWLKTLSFWNGAQPLAALHYYATHPMSYYGDGRVSSDFAGLARSLRESEKPHVNQIYFTGCAGNITAGKHNDGAKENRTVLRDRMAEAMKTAWAATRKTKLTGWEWRTDPVILPERNEKSFGDEESKKIMEDPAQKPAARNNAAFQLSWRSRAKEPIIISCLDFGAAAVVHLPGEPFIEYQLFAQECRTKGEVFAAGYGDGGPGYIPTATAYLEGGYEPTVALAGPDSEKILKQSIKKVLGAR